MRTRTMAVGVALVLGCTTLALARQNVTRNGSFEQGPGTSAFAAEGWTLTSGTTDFDMFRQGGRNFSPEGGNYAMRMRFDRGIANPLGIYQQVAVQPGDSIVGSLHMLTPAALPIGGDAVAGFALIFLNSNGDPISQVLVDVLDGFSAPDIWTAATSGAVVAPAGTAAVRYQLFWQYVTTSSGEAYADGCILAINGGGNVLVNGDFELVGPDFRLPAQWTGFGGFQWTEELPFHGVKSQNIWVNAASGFSGVFQDMKVARAGDRVRVQVWVYNPSAGGLQEGAAAAVKLEFQSVPGTSVPPPVENLGFDDTLTDDVWTPIALQTTVPTGITKARIVILQFDETDGNGPVWVDDARVTRSSQPGVPNYLLNGGFEDGATVPTHWTRFRGLTCNAVKSAFELPPPLGPVDGFSVLKISGNCVAGVYQDIEVTPGETIDVSAQFLSAAVLGSFAHPDASAGVKVEWIAGLLPPQVDIFATNENTLQASENLTDVWVPLWIDYTMPAGTAATLRGTAIVGRYGAPDAEVFFDGFEMVIVPFFNGSDVNNDELQDMYDLYWLQQCFTGGAPIVAYNCIVFDHNDDGDVDAEDWQFFAPRFTGP
ncbi:MAG: hypothetical protein IPM18_08695 [Phycisphaerales bacterium]|nr:hypothetical protein [Phycisphaerales bacterium]